MDVEIEIVVVVVAILTSVVASLLLLLLHLLVCYYYMCYSYSSCGNSPVLFSALIRFTFDDKLFPLGKKQRRKTKNHSKWLWSGFEWFWSGFGVVLEWF